VSIITDAISGLVTGISGAATSVMNAAGLLPADKQAELTATLAKLQTDANNAQNAVNQAEAGVTGTNFFKFFVAGWRPLIGWVCGFAFILQYILQPVVTWAGGHLTAIDMSVPTQVVLGMLGLGTGISRTVEKIQGAAGKHV
jgi:hypothetical protein